jgi:glutamate N-acetyltransferase/amino-acid N-acetyltransferase
MQKKINKVNVPGFLANGISVGIKNSEQKDLGLIYSNIPARVAAVFTKNAFKAAPVLINTERVKKGMAQAIITNSGCANAATGKEGYKDALSVSAELASQLNIKEDLILLGSTGLIGKRLPVKKINTGIGKLKMRKWR